MTLLGVSGGPHGVPEATTAGTPSPLSSAVVAEALETIELPAVLEVVASHAAGALGAERVSARRPSDDLEWLRLELARVGEIAALFRKGDGLLAEPVPDVRPVLSRLRVEGSVLESAELLQPGTEGDVFFTDESSTATAASGERASD